MARALSWENLKRVSVDELVEARIEAHHAAQWMARVARAFVKPEADDSHSALVWDSENRGLFCRPFGQEIKSLGLRIHDMTFLKVESYLVTDQFALVGKNIQDVYGWVVKSFGEAGPYGRLDTPLPYAIPAHPVGEGEAWKAEGAGPDALALWFNGAAFLLDRFVFKNYGFLKPGPSPVRCWPHHFDTACLVGLEKGIPENARAVGIGMSPGDETFPTPYFYINPWPPVPTSNLPEPPEFSQWNTEGFAGMIVTTDNMLELTSPPAQMRTYFSDGMDLSMELLGIRLRK